MQETLRSNFREVAERVRKRKNPDPDPGFRKRAHGMPLIR